MIQSMLRLQSMLLTKLQQHRVVRRLRLVREHSAIEVSFRPSLYSLGDGEFGTRGADSLATLSIEYDLALVLRFRLSVKRHKLSLMNL